MSITQKRPSNIIVNNTISLTSVSATIPCRFTLQIARTMSVCYNLGLIISVHQVQPQTLGKNIQRPKKAKPSNMQYFHKKPIWQHKKQVVSREPTCSPGGGGGPVDVPLKVSILPWISSWHGGKTPWCPREEGCTRCMLHYMDVSENRGTKMDGLQRKPHWKGWFGGTTIFGNIHNISSCRCMYPRIVKNSAPPPPTPGKKNIG